MAKRAKMIEVMTLVASEQGPGVQPQRHAVKSSSVRREMGMKGNSLLKGFLRNDGW